MDSPTENKIRSLFKENYQEWCVHSFAFLHNMDEAQDVVQDVLVKIISGNKLEGIANPSSYIKVAVKNASLQRIKTKQKIRKLDETPPLIDYSYEQELIEQENKAKVQNALNVLPDQSKKVFELCVIEGLQYKYTADIMGISINTVKYHLKKAYKILRTTLKDTYLFNLIVVIVYIFFVKK
ncbi:RNA polymerase sigma factor [Flagellimonas halotolerans]|uniref:Sigma-70 family RNA polymerase sigma factor n=1 Tax=Flagellimonas halotolerans TaxID=3112164 RepID=A0ABU6IPG1_9FLAO|nr:MULTISPECIES: sigma-70 family RNA polymerase sigma factor [unclassified Allomuricauda]MEC3965273.1 sigma-70 family RNA polymerase sigma factor [Muricauda sp. SYSU M86414]MEC4264882.1 sigma-70 family RNA polymerase sigma factor [Muricauda sp. SYSU M84420]